MCLWLCATSVHNTTQNSSDNLPSYLQTNIIAQMLSIGGEGAIWSRADKPGCNKGWIKQQYCLGYRVDTLNAYWPIDVHNLQLLSILRDFVQQLNITYINWYFQCHIVSLNFCKEYLNMATFKTTVLLLTNSWTFQYKEHLPMSSHTGVINF